MIWCLTNLKYKDLKYQTYGINIVHKPRNDEGCAPVASSAQPGQALSPPVPQFPWRDVLLAMRLAQGESPATLGAGVGNRWNS